MAGVEDDTDAMEAARREAAQPTREDRTLWTSPKFNLVATDPHTDEVRARVEGIGEQQVRSLTAVFEGDGWTVTATRR